MHFPADCTYTSGGSAPPFFLDSIFIYDVIVVMVILPDVFRSRIFPSLLFLPNSTRNRLLKLSYILSGCIRTRQPMARDHGG